MKKRERHIDINKLTTEQADNLSKQIGKSIAIALDIANNKCSEILKPYKLQTAICHMIMPLNSEKLKKIRKRASKNKQEIDLTISKIMQESSDKCNELLKIYGMQVQINYDIRQIQENNIKQ